jgi:hypothetical protein
MIARNFTMAGEPSGRGPSSTARFVNASASAPLNVFAFPRKGKQNKNATAIRASEDLVCIELPARKNEAIWAENHLLKTA